MQNTSVENSTEKPKDNFGIQNFYSPETLFALFTHDYKPRTLELQNNWEEIKVDSYDPISSVKVNISCRLKHEFDENVKDRYQKVFFMEGGLGVTLPQELEKDLA